MTKVLEFHTEARQSLKAGVDVLRYSLKQGISKNIYQKDLVSKLNYSNKTIIENLKSQIRTSTRI